MEFSGLVDRTLRGVWLHATQVHDAWKDATSPAVATYYVNLEFADSTAAQIAPREVEVVGRYPSLGIELRQWSHSCQVQRSPDGKEFPVSLYADVVGFLPALITGVVLRDSLGEGPASAVDLELNSGLTLTIRHIYPPMMLGIETRRRTNNEV
jgi:hypothetical protein